MKKTYLLALCIYSQLCAMDHNEEAVQLARSITIDAVSQGIAFDNFELVTLALRDIINQYKVKLGSWLCPLSMSDQYDPNCKMDIYIGHAAIRIRNLGLFKAYIDHLTPQECDIPNRHNQTLRQILESEIDNGHEPEILRKMLLKLVNKQRIQVPNSIQPKERIIGFNPRRQTV